MLDFLEEKRQRRLPLQHELLALEAYKLVSQQVPKCSVKK